jgi:hypothetical protein
MYLDVKVVGLENELYHTAGYEQRYFRSLGQTYFMVQYEISGVVLTLEAFSRSPSSAGYASEIVRPKRRFVQESFYIANSPARYVIT